MASGAFFPATLAAAGLCGFGFFATYVAQIEKVRLKGPNLSQPRLFGWILVYYFSFQIAEIAYYFGSFPAWAVVAGLCGSSFGISAGAVMLWCARVGRSGDA